MTNDIGVQWAYDTLVDTALVRSDRLVRARAEQFRTEVLDEMVGMACADIDWNVGKRYVYAYETVRNVCIELVEERRLLHPELTANSSFNKGEK